MVWGGVTQTAPPPAAFTLEDSAQSLTAQEAAKLLQRRAGVGGKAFIAAGAGATTFFAGRRLMIALAGRWTVWFLALACPRSPSLRLFSSAFSTMLAGAIPPVDALLRPATRRLSAVWAAIARQGMSGQKRSFTTFQQAATLSATCRGSLPRRRVEIFGRRSQGRVAPEGQVSARSVNFAPGRFYSPPYPVRGSIKNSLIRPPIADHWLAIALSRARPRCAAKVAPP